MSTNFYNKNYYPTPISVINQMIEGLNLNGKSVLDPSAGMGAILDHVKHKVGDRYPKYAIEIDGNFQKLLQGKGYAVLGSDFLEYSGAHAFDYILMNPPFDEGAKHLTKAIDIARPGCTIVCLLNSATLDGGNEPKKVLLKKINHLGGNITELGNVFSTAERKTNVSVSMVRIDVPTISTESFDFQFDAKKNNSVFDVDEDFSGGDQVQRYDKIKAYCDTYKSAVDAIEGLYSSMKKYNLYASVFGSASEDKRTYADYHNNMVMELQEKAWAKLFNESRISSILTEKVRKDFEEKRVAMGGFDLNVENINAAFGAIYAQIGSIRDQCISDAFDAVTKYSEENRNYFDETWKTNSHYMVGEKFILMNYDKWFIRGTGARATIEDLDRALCMVTGDSYIDIQTSSDALYKCFGAGYIKEFVAESHFFKMKLFKKGTIHFIFKDDKVRMEFNRRACAARGWQLPSQETFRGKPRR